jgi:hypothetical protein
MDLGNLGNLDLGQLQQYLQGVTFPELLAAVGFAGLSRKARSIRFSCLSSS